MSPKKKKCAQCGKIHPLDDLELSFKRADAIVELNDEDRRQLVKESDDLCTIEWKRYFVRGVLPLPVKEIEIPYNLGVWVEVDEPTFKSVVDNWEDPDQGSILPFDATLANNIPSLDDTVGLGVSLQLSDPSSRPTITLPRCEHPLYTEQSRGITEHRAAEYTDYFA